MQILHSALPAPPPTATGAWAPAGRAAALFIGGGRRPCDRRRLQRCRGSAGGGADQQVPLGGCDRDRRDRAGSRGGWGGTAGSGERAGSTRPHQAGGDAPCGIGGIGSRTEAIRPPPAATPTTQTVPARERPSGPEKQRVWNGGSSHWSQPRRCWPQQRKTALLALLQKKPWINCKAVGLRSGKKNWDEPSPVIAPSACQGLSPWIRQRTLRLEQLVPRHRSCRSPAASHSTARARQHRPKPIPG
jgi:hypothetical protein